MSGRQITVREYERLPISHDIGAWGGRALTPSEAEELLRFDDALPVRAFEHRHRSIRVLNYCGVVQVGRLTMEVLPKIATGGTAEQRASFDRRLLLRMLSIARDLPLIDADRAGMDLQREQLLEIVVRFFCTETTRQFHQGLIRRYVTAEESLAVIRGKWLLDAGLRLHVGRKDQVRCEYDEFTDDNAYNQVIQATLQLLIRRTRDNPRLNLDLRGLAARLSDVTEAAVSAQSVRDLPRDRLVARYETVFQMCEWFLSAESQNVRAGEERALGLLFDMNRLFEEVVAKVVRAVLPSGLQLRVQGPRYPLVRERGTSAERFRMKPDLCVIDADGKVVQIIDTKWKLIDVQNAADKYGISQSDMYQMFAYAKSYECNRVTLCYPAHADGWNAADLPTFDFLERGLELSAASVAIGRLNLEQSQSAGASLRGARVWREELGKQVRALVT